MSSLQRRVLGVFFLFLLLAESSARASSATYDVCIYGATSAGVMAAVETAREGHSVVLVEPGRHVGGMTSGGLSQTDIGNKAAIGGIAREFYHRMGAHYGSNETWKLEPSVAEKVFLTMLSEAHVPVYFQSHLTSVKKKNDRITSIKTTGGKTFTAKMFIDATYEGDLMARAGVSYFVGRESNQTYKETLDGIRGDTPKHQFLVAVDPYRKSGISKSGLLPGIQALPFGSPGAGDETVQAYNFRLCLTQNPTNRLPIQPPRHYRPAQYELLARYLTALDNDEKTPRLDQLINIQPMPNGKTDINNNGPFSTDFIGQNYGYPEGSESTRRRIFQAQENYTRGLLTFLAIDPRVPASVRAEMQSWGLCKDEFQDTGGWPAQMYVREARRMMSAYVMTENNCRYSMTVSDPIGLAAYTMDSHNCRRLVRNGKVENEGDVQVHGFPPFPISYRAVVPKISECCNLLVPVCLSASHIAYGSIRMEPVFMLLGQSCAMAAALAVEDGTTAQNIDYPELHRRMISARQVLTWPAPKPIQ